MPLVRLDDIQALVPLALLIAIVVMVQTAATTRSFVPQQGEAPDVNRDFVGVGAGSIASGLFAGFAVNASPPRTAIAAQSGGHSQLAGLFAAAIVLALGAFGGGLLANVPAGGPGRRADVRGSAYPALAGVRQSLPAGAARIRS